MKRILTLLLSILLVGSQTLKANECLELANYEMNDQYSTGDGCQDGVFNAVGASMIGWGVGLFAGIALLTGLIHSHNGSSTASSSTSDNSSN